MGKATQHQQQQQHKGGAREGLQREGCILITTRTIRMLMRLRRLMGQNASARIPITVNIVRSQVDLLSPLVGLPPLIILAVGRTM